MRRHNRSENGRGAWVALCLHPTHIDTVTVTAMQMNYLANTILYKTLFKLTVFLQHMTSENKPL
jgi:hypothetical protein